MAGFPCHFAFLMLEAFFMHKRTIVQRLTNNGASVNEQWCDDQRTMVHFSPHKHGALYHS